MSSMMGRLGLSGTSKTASTASPQQPIPQNVSSPHPNTNQPSMSSMAMTSINISSLTKKMGAGLNAGLNIANFTGTDPDKKAKLEAEEKKNQITLALSVLEDVRLQCPSTHTGLVLAYTGTTLSPIINPGIKFTWFRMSGEDQIDQLEESLRAWYPPTVDDIGCSICAQCEDNFDQGCSRYVECGPIKADELLCTVAESTVENGYFEAKEICVSLGLSQMESTVMDYQSIVQNHVNNETNNLLSNLTTVLAQDTAFLQLNGHSVIEVDESGVFISIPTFTKSTGNAHSSNKNLKTSRRGLRIPASTGLKVVCTQPLSLIMTVPITRKGIPDAHSDSAPPSEANSPRSPVAKSLEPVVDSKREGVDGEAVASLSRQNSSEQKTSSPGKEGSADQLSLSPATTPKKKPLRSTSSDQEEEKMKRFLSSSIVAIPWAYEGHNHSPEAYAADNEANLSAEEREKLMQSAEEDAIIFANTVCALAEFISALPEGTDELMICFSCTDRLVRDALALSIRSLSAQPNGCTRYERRRVFPWLSLTGSEEDDVAMSRADGAGLVGVSSESEQDVKRRLRAIEEENNTLKRERNELTMQLLGAREEMVSIKSHHHKNALHQSGTEDSSSTHSSSAIVVALRLDGDHSVVRDSAEVSSEQRAPLDASQQEAFKQLSCKVIELENKLAIDAKREVEAGKIRADIESRNNRLSQDVDKYKKSSEDFSRKLASLQALYDQQQGSIGRMETEQARRQSEAEGFRVKLREMDALQTQLVSKDAEISKLRFQLEESAGKVQAGLQQQAVLESRIETLEKEQASKSKASDAMIAQLEAQLSASIVDSKRLEREIFGLQGQLKDMEGEVQRAKSLEVALKEAENKADRLAGEVNGLTHKAESIGRDLKRVMKDNAMSLSEFEKALIRKSEECNDLYFKINEMKDAEAARQASDQSISASGLFQKLASNISKRESISNLSGHDRTTSTASSGEAGATESALSPASTSSIGSGGLSGMFRKASGML